MSSLSDFISSGAGGVKPFLDLGTVTGSQTIDTSAYSVIKLQQGDGDLDLVFTPSNTDTVNETLFYFDTNPDFTYTTSGANIQDFAPYTNADSKGVLTNFGSIIIGEGNLGSIHSPIDTKVYIEYSNTIAEYNIFNTDGFKDPDFSKKVSQVGATNIFGDTVDDIYVKPDGTMIYGINNATVYQVPLQRPYALASYGAVSGTLNFSATATSYLTFSTDGSRLFVGRDSTIYQFNLSDPWDINTAPTLPDKQFVYDIQNRNTVDISFSKNGKFLYTLDSSDVCLYQYYLKDSFELDTLVFLGGTAETLDNPTEGYFCFTTGFNDSVFFVVNSTTDRAEKYYVDHRVNLISQMGDNVYINTKNTEVFV